MSADASGLKRLALIPARGGSKRIPRKNIIDFHGKPMLGYSVDAALESGLFDRVHVSSDDDEVREIARQLGADADPQRPADLADDHTGILPVARWAVQEFAKQGERYDDVFILFACAPFIEAEELKQAYEVYLANERKRNLLTVCRAPTHVEQYYRLNAQGQLDPLQKGGNFIRSQDLDYAYFETGTFTIFSAEWLTTHPTLMDDMNYVGFELPEWKSVDIDSPKDLDYARRLYGLHQSMAKESE